MLSAWEGKGKVRVRVRAERDGRVEGERKWDGGIRE
jgi:hypothetical protein